MTISSIADYQSALKERSVMSRQSVRNNNGGVWGTQWDTPTSSQVPGVLAVGNTANGLVPTSATAGGVPINFGSGGGYLTQCELSGQVSTGRVLLYDRLFHAGAYAFNAAVTLGSQPSYASRVPGGSDFTGLQLWFETVTVITGNQSLVVTYTNQDGVAGRSTGTVAVAVGGVVGTSQQLPLQSGDSGIQKIESVTSTVASAGTFNILVVRPLRFMRFSQIVAVGPRQWLDRTGMPQVWQTSCLALMLMCDVTQISTLDVAIEIASK